MDAKNKNILIGGLLAIVLIMAVGYAAFATQLNINGTATISSTWNVHFDTSATDAQVIAINTATGGQTVTASKTITDLTATLTANLKQPGDSVTFTLPILNTGSIAATLDSPGVTMSVPGATGSGYSYTKGHIKWEVTTQPSASLAATSGTTNIVVVASFIATEGNVTEAETAEATITINYKQA